MDFEFWMKDRGSRKGDFGLWTMDFGQEKAQCNLE
jgi:hypothetical protein